MCSLKLGIFAHEFKSRLTYRVGIMWSSFIFAVKIVPTVRVTHPGSSEG